MADFVAVLKKTIDGLGDTTPDMRARVYAKARTTIAAKLAAISPPPPDAVIERQKRNLEDAISSVEADYLAAAAPSVAADDDLDSLMDALVAAPPSTAVPPSATAELRPVAPPPSRAENAVLPGHISRTDEVPVAAQANGVSADRQQPASLRGASPAGRAPARSRNGGRIAVALIALVFASVAGYAVWLNKDEVSTMLGLQQVAETNPPAEAEAPAEVAAVEPAPAPVAPAAPAADPAEPKFTQRLNADGSEIDDGPANGVASIGEGTTVAAVTVPPPAAPAAPAATTPPADQTAAAEEPVVPAAPEAPAAAQPAIAVGQRTIFYEERTSASQGSAEQGNIVWSLVQESPGGDLPPEPAIRAEAAIPGKDLQLRMTIRRNGDPTLPASHIIELIFLTPENFDGGVIDNVLRMTMKETEESTGRPILGLPAKIGDGFFLIALADTGPEMEANMQLFRNMKWIDVPIVYGSGRRALVTMERGIPGDRVFEEAMRAWAAKSG